MYPIDFTCNRQVHTWKYAAQTGAGSPFLVDALRVDAAQEFFEQQLHTVVLCTHSTAQHSTAHAPRTAAPGLRGTLAAAAPGTLARLPAAESCGTLQGATRRIDYACARCGYKNVPLPEPGRSMHSLPGPSQDLGAVDRSLTSQVIRGEGSVLQREVLADQ
jgi:hypothetical protein